MSENKAFPDSGRPFRVRSGSYFFGAAAVAAEDFACDFCAVFCLLDLAVLFGLLSPMASLLCCGGIAAIPAGPFMLAIRQEGY
jgi:hypothetical protein